MGFFCINKALSSYNIKIATPSVFSGKPNRFKNYRFFSESISYILASYLVKEENAVKENGDVQITYKQGMSGRELFSYIKAIGVPAGVFLISMFIVSLFGAFGTNLLAPMAGGMWIFGALVAFMIPSQRESICNETHMAVLGYLAAMYGLRLLIGLVSGVSSEQLMATYNQAMPMSSGNTIIGFLQTFLWITAVMVPVGFLGMQGKKLIMFRKRMSKQKFMDQLRGIRDNGQGHNDYRRQ